jgi:small-conductance mechanosensitive channel
VTDTIRCEPPEEVPTSPRNEVPLPPSDRAHIQILVEAFDEMRDAFKEQQKAYEQSQKAYETAQVAYNSAQKAYEKWSEQVMRAVQEITASKTLQAEVVSLHARVTDMEKQCAGCKLRAG